MESTVLIKEELISKIKDSNDLSILKTLQEILDSSEESIFKLSPEQEKFISTGRKQIKNGEFSSN